MSAMTQQNSNLIFKFYEGRHIRQFPLGSRLEFWTTSNSLGE